MAGRDLDGGCGLARGLPAAFAPAEVVDNFERYAKLFHEIFGGRSERAGEYFRMME
ncbi:MAG: hypothetical protein ACXW6K_27015 [Candidatus Binatia bacterium]